MKQAQRITDLYIAALLTLFLLAMGPAGYTAVTAFKFRLLLTLTGLWLAGLLFTLARRRVPLPRPDLWEWLVLGYGGLTLLSALVRGAPLLGASRREGALSILVYCLIALGVRRFGTVRRRTVFLLGAVMTVWCCIALLQFAGANPFGLYPGQLTWQDAGVAYSGAYISTTGNTDLAGALLCLAVPALTGTMLTGRGKGRFLLALPLCLCLIVTAGMEYRGAVLALAAGLPCTLALVPENRTARRRLLAGCALCLLAALLLVWAVRLPGTLGEAHDLLRGQADINAGSGRLYIWKNCLPLIRQNPLLGTGPDRLHTAGLFFENTDPATGAVRRSSIDTAHNEFLNVAVQQGIPALLCFLGALGLSLLGPRQDAAARIGRACLICWGIQACFGFSMINTAPYFWLTLAFCAPEVSQ